MIEPYKSCWKYVQLFELVRGRQSGAKAGVGIAIYRADQRQPSYTLQHHPIKRKRKK